MDIQHLRKILELEVKRGYDDRAVIGGLDRFLANWVKETSQEATSPRLVTKLRSLRPDGARYSDMDIKHRQEWLSRTLRSLDDMEAAGQRPPVSAPPKKPPVPPTPATVTTRPAPGLSAADKDLLGAPITTVRGISSAMAAKFARLEVNTVRDLLYFFPRRHLDYSKVTPISALKPGEEQTIIANVWEASIVRLGHMRCTQVTVGDDSGNIKAIWFNQPYLAKSFRTNEKVVLSGRVTSFRGWNQMESPAWELLKDGELLHTARLVPVYSLTAGLFERQVRRLIKEAVDRWAPLVDDFLPPAVRDNCRLLGLTDALLQAHYPDSQQLKDNARERLAFDELLLLQLGVLSQKQHWQESQPGNAMAVKKDILERFLRALPFPLTGAQSRALQEILADLEKSKAMGRLLQGEVGSGKTVVALAALLMTIANGYQGAVMAPTEILAEQHFRTFIGLLSGEGCSPDVSENTATVHFPLPVPFTIALITGSTRGKKALHRLVSEGQADLIIGTHALIQERVEFKALGLAVIDEQHRFGVLQRSALRQKGFNPHVLIMTATPIPRTLALTLYGDLDLSIINELPPGRQKVLTKWVVPEKRPAAYEFLRQQIKEGRQAFIVCPLIEESEAIETKAAVEEYKRLSQDVFSELRLGLLHGKMVPAKKEETMRLFRDGAMDILVSTPVVEVGIDVPNATVMLVEGADRFGLSQLHQFRGRVGRGKEKSYCLLLAEDPSPEARERLSLIAGTQNGFDLAEADLKLRGPGEFFGTRQSGLPDLRMARLSDVALLESARREAKKLFTIDPALQAPEHLLLRKEMARAWKGGGEWS